MFSILTRRVCVQVVGAREGGALTFVFLIMRRRTFFRFSCPPTSSQRMVGGLRLMSCMAVGLVTRRACSMSVVSRNCSSRAAGSSPAAAAVSSPPAAFFSPSSRLPRMRFAFSTRFARSSPLYACVREAMLARHFSRSASRSGGLRKSRISLRSGARGIGSATLSRRRARFCSLAGTSSM